jgi:hypothetical protein
MRSRRCSGSGWLWATPGDPTDESLARHLRLTWNEGQAAPRRRPQPPSRILTAWKGYSAKSIFRSLHTRTLGLTGRKLSALRFDALDESIAGVQRSFEFSPRGQQNGMPIWTINGQPFDPALMDSTEIWELTAGPLPARGNGHPVHLVHFEVLFRNNGEPRPTEAGWKDTVDLTAG